MKAVDELLNKAQQVMSQLNFDSPKSFETNGTKVAMTSRGINSSHSKDNKTPINSSRADSAKGKLVDSRRPPVSQTNARNTLTQSRVARPMPVTRNVARPKSSSLTRDKSATSTDSRDSLKENVLPRNTTTFGSKSTEKLITDRDFNLSTEPMTKIVNVVEKISFNELAPTLSLPSKLSNLINNNSKLHNCIQTEKHKRKSRANTRNVFMEKFNAHLVRKESVFGDNLNLKKMSSAYQNASNLITEHEFLLRNETNIANDTNSKGKI